MPFGPKRITLKQKKFAKAYVENGGNATQAALDSYNIGTRKTAKRSGHDLIRNPKVQAEIGILLNRAGLSLEDLNINLADSISFNLKNGKASQAVAASMIQFAYKLHNVVPANKSVKMSLALRQNLPSKDMDQVLKTLENLNAGTNKLIQSLSNKNK